MNFFSFLLQFLVWITVGNRLLFLICEILRISEKGFNSVEIFAPSFISCFCSTSNGDTFVFYMLLENKKSRFRLEIRMSLSFIFFKVVPPGIEPFASVYSNSLSDCTFFALSFMKTIELALR